MVLDRRGFIKFAAGAGAGIMVTPLPWKLLDDSAIWTQNWSWIPSNIPGQSTYVSTTSKLCPTGCGMKVRLVDGRPVRTVSNPEHPLGGGISALAAAEVQMLYSPARLRRPLHKTGDGAYVQISWAEAEALLQKKIQEAGADIACISGDESGSSLQVLSAFLKALGSSDFYLMPSEGQAASVAWQKAGGKGQLGYDLEKSDCILAIGANILESWGTAIHNRKVFDKTHPNGGAASMRLFYAGPVQNNTAAVADKWLPIKPGTEAALALGLAASLIQSGKNIDAAFAEYAAPYTPAKTAELTGLPEAQLAEMAKALLEAKAPLIIVGSEFNQGAGALPILVGLALNKMLQAPIVDIPLPQSLPGLPGSLTRQQAYSKDLNAYLAGKPTPKALLVYEANPVYALPNPAVTEEAFKNIPFKVAFTTFLDETAMLCDLVLPMPLGLERLDDVESPYGCSKATYAFSVPVIKPLVDAKPGQDVVLSLAAALKLNLAASYQQVLAAKAALYNMGPADLSAGKVAQLPGEKASLGFSAALLSALKLPEAPKGSVALAPMHSLKLGTPKTGIPPFNTKTLRATELIGRDMTVMLNGATAAKLGLRPGSPVSLSAPDSGVKLMARVTIFEGIAPDTAGVYLGFGHTALDEFSQKKGGNIMQLLTASAEEGTGLSVWNLASVNIAKA